MAKRSAPATAPVFTGEELVVVLHGKESFLQTLYMRRLRVALEKKTGGEVETLRYDGRNATLADVFDELRSFGLMQQHKLVVVDDADEFVKEHRAALERYAAEPVDCGTLLLRASKWNKGNLDKAIAKVGVLGKCEPFTHARAEKWVMDHCLAEHGVKMAPRAASLLVDHLGADLGRLDAESGKLAAATPVGESIAPEQVEQLVGHNSDEAAWEIQEALLSGNADRALTKLHELVDLAGQPDVLVTYFVADLVRKLHHASVMLKERQNDFTICKTLKIWGDRQKPFMTAARRLGPSRAAALLKELVLMDRRAKTGYSQGMRNLECFCVRFADNIS
jgi:DNA polymerase-3 subunit delta